MYTINSIRTCKDCSKFIGAGDWDLCCMEEHEGYPLGFICYEDTLACEKFEEKKVEYKEGRLI